MATTSELTPYEILEVVESNFENIDLTEIFKRKIHAYKRQEISAVKYRRIIRAYEILSNQEKRQRYNTERIWTPDLPIDQYTPQQLAAEPELLRDLKKRLDKATLTEINAKDPVTGHTPLYSAARAGNLEAVKFLTEHGAEPDVPQNSKSTALHVAAFYGHADVVRCLLESGANYRSVNRGLCTAEQEIDDRDVDVKQVFKEMKSHPFVRVAADELEWLQTNGLTEHRDKEYFSQRQTLLHCASKKGYFDMVRWLVETCSADINLVDFNENSALHFACYGGYQLIVSYLLERGADSTLKNRWGTTAEEEGCKHGRRITDRFKTIRELDMFEMARQGKDWWFYYYFNEITMDKIDSNGVSLLYYASRHGHYSLAKWLLAHGANVNIQMSTGARSTPLHGAKYRGHVAVVELLLEYGADVNIKNEYGANIFLEETSADVDKESTKKIDKILEQYKNNLKTDKLLDVHIFDDENDGHSSESVMKIKLTTKSTYNDLVSATGNHYSYFSIARRLLQFNTPDSTVLSAIYRARYACSKFIDTPIHLSGHRTLPNKNQYQQVAREAPKFEHRAFSKYAQRTSLTLKAPVNNEKSFEVHGLTILFAAGCVTDDVKFDITTVLSPNQDTFDLTGCLCFFQIELRADQSKLVKLPSVFLSTEPTARLYTMAVPTFFWFSSQTCKNVLPVLGNIHAFVRHRDIIPGHLTLPTDVLLAAHLNQPLEKRTNPLTCMYLKLRDHDTQVFPKKGYHGTNIFAVQSIIFDGLVVPGTVVSSGFRVSPPKNHFARGDTYFGIKNFADAIFLSPSVHYSADPVYARPFTHEDQQWIPVIECSVKNGSYKTFPSTVENYKARPGENVNAIEWRIEESNSIELIGVLFVTTLDSITAAKKERMKKAT